ncbi:MAG: 50S ribosomal protein L24 [Woeseiaceae bacterium]
MRKIRKGDEVVVMTGKDKGRRGTVLQVLEDERVLVEGINVAKKHQKGNPQQGVQGGIVDKEMPLAVSNLRLFNPKTKKGDRIGFRIEKGGDKVRIFKSTGEAVDV